MAKVDFNAEHKKVLDDFLLHLPDVSAGKMFGYPAYYVHRKLFDAPFSLSAPSGKNRASHMVRTLLRISLDTWNVPI